MDTILHIPLQDFSMNFISDLKEKFGKTAQIEIKVREISPSEILFSETDFWSIIDKIDWSKKPSEAKLKTAVKTLSKLPVSNIYLFADKLAEKLFLLDTAAHGKFYLEKDAGTYFSVDDFLYVRCAVIAEGREYFEKVLQNPAEMPNEITFEPILYLANSAFELKIGKEFDYFPTFNYETYSNKAGWQTS
jgi:hypothetical protein